MREAEKMANERGGKFWGSDDVGAASRGVAPWRRGVAIGRHFTLNFIQAFLPFISLGRALKVARRPE